MKNILAHIDIVIDEQGTTLPLVQIGYAFRGNTEQRMNLFALLCQTATALKDKLDATAEDMGIPESCRRLAADNQNAERGDTDARTL